MSEENIGTDKIYETPNLYSVPRQIASRIEDYLVNGREEFNGRLADGVTVTTPRDGGLGSRAGLCGFACGYGLEVVNEVKNSGIDLVAVQIQAERLSYVVKELDDVKFRRHGFLIVFDNEDGGFWLIDKTFNQFVVGVEDDELILTGPEFKYDQFRKVDSFGVEVAKTLLEEGYIKLNPETLAVYLSLILDRDRDGFYDEMVKKFSDRDNFIGTLLEICRLGPEGAEYVVGDLDKVTDILVHNDSE